MEQIMEQTTAALAKRAAADRDEEAQRQRDEQLAAATPEVYRQLITRKATNKQQAKDEDALAGAAVVLGITPAEVAEHVAAVRLFLQDRGEIARLNVEMDAVWNRAVAAQEIHKEREAAFYEARAEVMELTKQHKAIGELRVATAQRMNAAHREAHPAIAELLDPGNFD